jgi:H+-translocating NAD(P) transhydrogenase subunit alpha
VRIGVPKETASGERRVALVPEVVRKLSGGGHAVVVEAGAGEAAGIPDALFEEAGAMFGDPWEAEVIAKVVAPEDTARLSGDSVLIGFLAPLTNADGARAIAATGATAFAMDAIPRISRAQSMDALSSQATVAGYRAALIGAQELGRFYPMLMTAAGDDPPGAGARAGRRRRRAAGDRHRAAAGRGGDCVRRALRGRRAGQVAGREVPRSRGRRGRRGGRRLRP